MLRIANMLGKYKALVTGESLGQVASQTLYNMACEDSASKIPVLRPLLGFNKNEIIKIAQQIETFGLSKEHKCCAFVPAHPRTKARMHEIEREESKIDMEKLVKESLAGAKIIRC